MNDIYSGVQKGVFGSVFDKAKEALFTAGGVAIHYAHNAFELIAGEDGEEVDLEANGGFQREFRGIHKESHHDFLQYDE